MSVPDNMRSVAGGARRGRVVFFSAGHAEPGGCANHSQLLATGLAGRGWQVRAVTRAGGLRRFRIEREANLTVVEIPGFGSRLGALLFLACAVPLGIAWGRRDAAILAFQLSSQATAAGLCARALRRPFIALATSGGPTGEIAYVSRSRLGAVHRRQLRRASWLVGQTDSAARELETLVPRERVAVVPTPVALVRDPPALSGRPHALFSGRLSKPKDLPTLLRAWRPLAESRPDARLTLLGEGGAHDSVEDSLKSIVAGDEILQRSVQLPGWVMDVAPYLREADVYVLPSVSEGMSNALLEACAWRRVVVASDIPSNLVILGEDYPLLFPAGDSAALAKALRRAFDDEATRRDAVLRIAGRMERFSVERVVDSLEELMFNANGSGSVL